MLIMTRCHPKSSANHLDARPETRHSCAMLRIARLLLLITTLVASSAATAENITVFAAASMKNALEELGRDFEEETRHKVVFSFGGSAALARQIEHAAPADIFISANAKWMTYLVDKGAISPENLIPLASNQLVVVARSDAPSPSILSSGSELVSTVSADLIATGILGVVPAGIYAKEALTSLGIWDKLGEQLVETDNVRAALNLVSLGETPYGIVYASDAISSPNTPVIFEFPPETHSPISYPAAMVSSQPNAATYAFFQFLSTPSAKYVFRQHGFLEVSN